MSCSSSAVYVASRSGLACCGLYVADQPLADLACTLPRASACLYRYRRSRLGTLGLGGDRREAPRAPAIPLPVDHSIPEKGLYQPKGKGLKCDVTIGLSQFYIRLRFGPYGRFTV